MDERVQHWLELAQDKRIESRMTGKLGFTTTEDRYFDLLGEITKLRDALGEACGVIKVQSRIIDKFETILPSESSLK